MACRILRAEEKISDQEWQMFIRGSSFIAPDLNPKNPHPKWLPNSSWAALCALETHLPGPYQGLQKAVENEPELWKSFYDSRDIATQPNITGFPHLTSFQRLLLVTALRAEKVYLAATRFICDCFGPRYTDPSSYELSRVLEDTSAAIPVLFILSSGADPVPGFIKFAESKGKKDMSMVSLGQGQERNALQAFQNGAKHGDWVLLQNCHLSRTFMGELEKQVLALVSVLSQNTAVATEAGLPEPLRSGNAAGSATAAARGLSSAVNTSFRLWLTSMPCDFFSVPVLQNSLKLSSEAPSGIRTNLLRVYADIAPFDSYFPPDQASYITSTKMTKRSLFPRLLWGLCFFHAILLERKKFGPLGWNVRYEFNDTDIEVSKQWLWMLLQDATSEIPWSALHYIIGEIHYGGRVTDPWDRRTLFSILGRYFGPAVLTGDFLMGDTYQLPNAPPLESVEAFQSYVEREISRVDEPEVFGMHPNANLRYQQVMTKELLSTILRVEPKTASLGAKSQAKVKDEKESAVEEDEANIVIEDPLFKKADEFLGLLPDCINVVEERGPKCYRSQKEKDASPDSLYVVLTHEIARFNKLLERMKGSLMELKKALAGLTVLSDVLDRMCIALRNDMVPENWTQVSYDSVFPLGQWFKDLVDRVGFMRRWIRKGEPNAFPLPFFFYPHGFMTGVLQRHARSTLISIDQLSFSFSVLDVREASAEDALQPPTSGVYVYGLFTDAFIWKSADMQMAASLPGVIYDRLPPVHFLPEASHVTPTGWYRAPLYKTPTRAGILTSLGASSNFILAVELPSAQPSSYWECMGAALLTMTDGR